MPVATVVVDDKFCVMLTFFPCYLLQATNKATKKDSKPTALKTDNSMYWINWIIEKSKLTPAETMRILSSSQFWVHRR